MYKDIYLAYLRKSQSDNPHETVEETLAKHYTMLQNAAVSKIGHTIPEEYIFREVVSGETIEDRPEIKAVLSRIESPDVKGVFVVDPQRLSRGDWEDGGKILSSFKYTNTLIITPMVTYNLHVKYDYDLFKMELTRGNDFLEYTKEIFRRGRVASVESGNYIGSVAPYGYKKIFDDDKNPTLEPVEKEAEAINIAVRKRVYDGMGWAYIARELDRMGYEPKKKGLWDPYTLRDICINPVNIGKVVWNSRKTVKIYEDGKLVKTRPRNREDVLVKDGKHPSILDLELYEKLLAVSGIATREKKTAELVNPLAGLIYCGTCGRAMSYRVYTNKGVVKCAPRLLCNNQVNCHTKSAEFSIVYDTLIDILESVIEDFKFKLENENHSVYDAQARMIQAYYDDLKRLDKKRENIYDLVESGDYTKELFRKRIGELEEEYAETEKRIAYLKENTPEPIDYKEKIVTFRHVVETLKDENVSAKHKNNLLKTIVSRIDYFRVEIGENTKEKGYICFYRERGNTNAKPQEITAHLPNNATKGDAWHYFQNHIGNKNKIVKIIRDSKRRTVYDATKPMLKIKLNDF